MPLRASSAMTSSDATEASSGWMKCPATSRCLPTAARSSRALIRKRIQNVAVTAQHLGIVGDGAGRQAHGLDVGDARQPVDRLLHRLAVHQRFAAGEHDLPDVIVAPEVVQRRVHVLHRRGRLLPALLVLAEAETAVDRAAHVEHQDDPVVVHLLDHALVELADPGVDLPLVRELVAEGEVLVADALGQPDLPQRVVGQPHRVLAEHPTDARRARRREPRRCTAPRTAPGSRMLTNPSPGIISSRNMSRSSRGSSISPEADLRHGRGRRPAQLVQDRPDEGLGLVLEAAGRDQPRQALLAVALAQHVGQLGTDDDPRAVPVEEVDQAILDEADVDFAQRQGSGRFARPDARFRIHIPPPFVRLSPHAGPYHSHGALSRGRPSGSRRHGDSAHSGVSRKEGAHLSIRAEACSFDPGGYRPVSRRFSKAIDSTTLPATVGSRT